MSGLTGNNILSGSSGQATGYNIDQSLRFEDGDSAYLNRTPASASNRKTWTFSAWVKRGNLGISSKIFQQRADSNGSQQFQIAFQTDDTIRLIDQNGGTTQGLYNTTAVYRDSSAWYHIVVACDTTNATASDRVKLYVNGVRVTNFSTTDNWPLNYNTSVNNTVRALIGVQRPNSSGTLNAYLDGYLAEVNLIDGQALDATAFGETNEDTNRWQAIGYAGSYGTNGFYLPFSNGTSWSNYFDFSGDYIRVPSNSGAPFDFGTGNFTVEGWFYLTTSGSWTSYWGISEGGGASQKINLYDSTGNGTLDVDINGSVVFSSSAVLTDLQNKWAHIALVREGTGTNQTKLYVNGSVVGQGTVSANFSGFTQPFTVGHNGELYSGAFKGYISNFRVVKGTAVYTGSFTPPTSDLTAISGTQLLTCQNSTFVDNSANNLTVTVSGDTRTEKFSPISLDFTDDHSGNGNNFIPTNLTYSDVVLDSPTNNFATLNSVVPPNLGSFVLSEGNLRSYAASNSGYPESTIAISSGKYYAEMYCEVTQSNDSDAFGFTDTGGGVSSMSSGIAYRSNGKLFVDGLDDGTYATYATGDVVGMAINADDGAVYFYKNGTLITSRTSLSYDIYKPFVYNRASFGSTALVTNFGQDSSFAGNKTAQGNGGVGEDFYYTPPTGYKALNTDNLPDSSIALPNEHFNTVLYTGNGSTQSITGVGFQPDFTWLKNRGSSYQHQAYDAVRGATKKLLPSSNSAETTDATALSSFDSDGFSLGSNVGVNQNTINHVAWNWKAGGTASSNTDGTITSTVSASNTVGFSIVKYTGTGVAGDTMGHGLSQAPEMVIMKKRISNGSDGVRGWHVWHKDLTDGNYLALHATNAQFGARDFGEVGSGTYPYTAPTSSLITFGGVNTGQYQEVNYNGDDYIMYCFHSVDGYSKVGSYTGNGSTDGTFFYTGFRPAFIMFKNTTATGNWVIVDNKRNTYNEINKTLWADLTSVEGTYAWGDFTSNGFKFRNTSNGLNNSGQDYIYLAIAESPFKYSNAR